MNKVIYVISWRWVSKDLTVIIRTNRLYQFQNFQISAPVSVHTDPDRRPPIPNDTGAADGPQETLHQNLSV